MDAISPAGPPAATSTSLWESGGYAALTGGVLCALAGGIAGTLVWPVVGTFFEGLIGAAIGMVVGPLLGLTFASTLHWRRSATGAICACAAVGGIGGWAIAIQTGRASPSIGAVFGAAFGLIIGGSTDRALGLHGSPASPHAMEMVARYALAGLFVAATVGAVGGFVFGVITYLPTSPFAAIEGAVLMTPTGAILGAVAGLIRAQFVSRPTA
jgi:hypothetical protein